MSNYPPYSHVHMQTHSQKQAQNTKKRTLKNHSSLGYLRNESLTSSFQAKLPEKYPRVKLQSWAPNIQLTLPSTSAHLYSASPASHVFFRIDFVVDQSGLMIVICQKNLKSEDLGAPNPNHDFRLRSRREVTLYWPKWMLKAWDFHHHPWWNI